jgi:disulfide oxidoreductase YuzD
MKLIIKQYLASLRERDELDAVLPDLLSQMGLNVISRPGRGTRQAGVDVAAVGKIDGEEDKIYLFSIKPGDLTRSSWNGESVQSLRPSLDEILDSYIPTRLPDEHKDKPIVICICIGGDIQEQVRVDVEGYVKKHIQGNLNFEEWNGDKLATLIMKYFLQEDLLPSNGRSELRKSLALLDEPEASYQHFTNLIKSLFEGKSPHAHQDIVLLRQINICLWILFAWARDIDNLESAYLSSELASLYAWEITKPHLSKGTKVSTEIQSTLVSVLNLHQQISAQYISRKIIPHVAKKHALSSAVHSSSSLDVNLRLFDILGRLALSGIWAYSSAKKQDGENTSLETFQFISVAVRQLILNNPILWLPIKDDQAIDISLAVFLLVLDSNNHEDVKNWLSEIIKRATFSCQIQGQYPCILQRYSDLVEHPAEKSNEYREKVTSGSILYPLISFWAALLADSATYNQVQYLKKNILSHSNFQMWYPDDASEAHFYLNDDFHGAVLSHVCVDRSMDELLNQIFGECEHSPQFERLSAIEFGLLPLILIACRHYRLPLPPHLWKRLQKNN